MIDPTNDPNEAYELTHPPGKPHSIPADWWMITCNGIPVHFFAPSREAEARRYCIDPEYRLSLEPGPKLWEKSDKPR